MQARAGAIDELIASGALDDASSINRGDDISRELEAMSSQSDVESELAALKGSSPQAIEASETPARHPGRGGQSSRGLAGREGTAGMIVRILGEGQLEVADDQLDALNELDSAVESAVEAGDEAGVQRRAAARCSTAYDAPAPRSPRTPSRTPT